MSDRNIFAEIDAHENNSLLELRVIAWAVAEFEEAYGVWPSRFTLQESVASGIAALTTEIHGTFAVECPTPYSDETDFRATAARVAQNVEDALWAVESGEHVGSTALLAVFAGGMGRLIEDLVA